MTVRTTASITAGTPPRTTGAGETPRDLDAERARTARRADMFRDAAHRVHTHYEVRRERWGSAEVTVVAQRGFDFADQYWSAHDAVLEGRP